MKKILSAIVISVMLTFSSPCHAGFFSGLFSLFGGIIPVIEPVSTASELGKTISVAVTEAKAALNSAKQALSNLRTAVTGMPFLTKYLNKVSGFNNLMGAKYMVESKSLEEILGVEDLNHDEAAVKRAIYRLFLEYPSEDILVQLAYREKAQEFYDDTIIDIYSSSRELSRYLENDVAGKFANLREKMQKGQDGAKESTNMNATLFNNYVAANMTMDSIIAVVHEATALKAQLEAARAIRDKIKPLVYSGKKVSFNALGSGRVGDSYELSFAHLSEDEIYKREDYQDRDSVGQVSFELGQNPMIINPLYENSKKIEELGKLEPIYNNIKKAFTTHNLIKRIYHSQENFEKYQRLVTLHERAKVQLAMSDQCAVNFLSNIFVDAGKVWCGYSNCQYIDDYATREGISAWGLKSYYTAQAANAKNIGDAISVPTPATPVPSEDEITLDTLNTNNRIEGIKTERDKIYTSLGLDVPENETEEDNMNEDIDSYEYDEMDDEGRITELLPWQIGAIGMEEIAAQPSAWGTTRDTFRVWNDVRSFYTQFLMFKYENFYTRIRADVSERIVQQAMVGWNIANRNNAEKKVKETAEKNKQKVQSNADKAREKAYKSAESAQNAGKEYDLNGKLAEIEAELNEKVKEIEDDLTEKLNSIESEFNINESYIPKFTPIETDIANRGDIIKDAFKSIISAGETAKKALIYRSNPLGTLYKQAKTLFDTADLYLLNSIESAKSSMCPKGESIYLSDMVQSIHKDLVDKLIAYFIPVIDDNGETIHKIIPFGEYLASKDTSPETEEYFVGSTAKDRDLKAPKNPPKMTYAPFREVFHYDNVDWDNSQPLTKEKFLSYGGKIPEIWKILLSDKNPFVEHEFDLDGILDGDYLHRKANYKLKKRQGHLCPTLQVKKPKPARYLTLSRGGVMPCMITNVKTDNVKGPDMSYFTALELVGADIMLIKDTAYTYMPKKTLTQTLSNNGLGVNPCVGITLSGSNAFGKLYHQKADAKFSLSSHDISDAYGRSELGVFLESKDNNISFRDDFEKLFKEIKKIEEDYNNGKRDEKSDRKLSNGKKIKEHTLYLTPFLNNMIGNNIMVVDTEHEYREAKENMEAEIASLREELLKTFADLGLEAPADLDLSRTEDYEDCMDTLESYKTTLLGDIEKGIRNTNVTDNHVLKTRLDAFKGNLDALKQDKDEMIELGENAKGGPELEEEIEQEKADRKAHQSYKDDEQACYEEALESMAAPYCPNINDGSYQIGCPTEQNLTAKR